MDVRGPDGKIVRFPDGTDAGKIDEVMSSIYAKPKAPPRASGTLGQLGRQLGLAARYVPEGLSEVAGLVTNPINTAINTGLQAFGSKARIGTDLGRSASNALDSVGLPRPNTPLERVVGDASRAVVGSAPFIGAGQVMAKTASPLLRSMGSALATNPGTQARFAAGGAASAGGAREAGLPPALQIALGLGIPMAASSAVAAGRRLTTPMRASGRDRIAGTFLAEQAQDPNSAIQNLQKTREIVPGSMPTIGGASGDIGLTAFEKAVSNKFPGLFGQRRSEQNFARQAALDGVAGTETDLANAISRRDRITGPMRDAAFANSAPVDNTGLLANADNILTTPGNRQAAVVTSIGEFRKRIAQATDPQELYAIRKDIGLAMGGKLSGDRQDYRFAKKQLMELRGGLDDTIEAAAPGFKKYLGTYKGMSRPINQMEILQDIQKRGGLSQPDVVSGRDVLSQAKFTRSVDSALSDPETLRALNENQIETLRKVAADLDRGAAISTPTLRTPGSDTLQNMSMANVIGARLGGSLPPALAWMERPFRFLFKLSDQNIQQLLADAALDPALAAALMTKATPENARRAGQQFEIWARQRGIGTALGTGTAR